MLLRIGCNWFTNKTSNALSCSIAPLSAVSGPDVIALAGLPVSLCFGVPWIVYTRSLVKAFSGPISKLDNFYDIAVNHTYFV